MSSWNKCTLGELAKKGKGFIQTGPFGSQLHVSDYVDDGIPIIMPVNLKENRIDISKVSFISENDLNRLSKHIVKSGDIIYSRRGDVTQKALITKKEEGFFCGTGCLLIRVKDSIDPNFLVYLLSTSRSKSWIANHAVGITMPNLNTKILARFPISFPEQKIQKQIAKVLSDLDQKIELNNQINAELEAMAKLVYDYWFVQFDFPISASYAAAVGKPELEGKPYQASGGQLVYNEELKREIPEGWGNGVFEDVAKVIGGSTPSKADLANFTQGNGTPWITPKDLSNNKDKKYITRGEFDVTEQGIKKGSLKLMPQGTVLLSSRAPIGYLAIARETVTTNQGFKSFIPKSYFTTEFLYYQIQNKIPLIEARSGGSTFKEVSSSTLKTVRVILPPLEIIEEYQKIAKPIFEKQNVLEQENQEIASLRDWLLPMLMNGQVTVGNLKLNTKKEVEVYGEEFSPDGYREVAEERENYKTK